MGKKAAKPEIPLSVNDWHEKESFHSFGRRATRHLRRATPGTTVQNVVSGTYAFITMPINPNHPYVNVRLLDSRRRQPDRETAWFAGHVVIPKK